ncbi:hypothetical protein IC762_16440 [Bradyrhizobium genosp. L]|uniref:hypothetical protein n=1 Tax=Bradyrhizobium genosp. L TaxID=83637 RepID=UPI0018A31C04|nr:hypothetical protein [Bradyrhizobium genosp. L]QPF87781.1 hypothetical protein IC762_16440 [Bradyrhizobium genosp. L]
MTPIKCLSAALLAIAMLTTSAMAEASLTTRYGGWRGGHGLSQQGPSIDSNARIPAPSAGEFSVPSRNVPGGVCDHGDNPMIC